MAKLGKDEMLDLDVNSPNYGDQLMETLPEDSEGGTIGPVMSESLSQAIRIKILFVLGEWFLDASIGMPYYEIIWVKNPNIEHIKSAFRTKILEVPGVKEVTQLSALLDPRTRTLNVTWTVTTDFGELEGTVIV